MKPISHRIHMPKCLCVCVSVRICVRKFCWQSKLKNLQPRPAPNRPNEENVVSVTVFHCFASLSPTTQRNHRKTQSLFVCMNVCVRVTVSVSIFLWKFTKTFRRHFVYFSCAEQGSWNKDKSFGRPPSMRFLLRGIRLLM